ncbi:MAG: T9SS type A sorting domain-containing protein [Patescibacteria group bacterium]|nr:T9SS type A sorting domain-containing protein [Patescibacteria group bacterium]
MKKLFVLFMLVMLSTVFATASRAEVSMNTHGSITPEKFYSSIIVGMDNTVFATGTMAITQFSDGESKNFYLGGAFNHFESSATDKDNSKWFGGQGGVVSYYNGIWKSYTISTNSYISSIAVDRDNVKWFAAQYAGIFSFDGMEWRHFQAEDGFIDSAVYSCHIAVDRDNVKWFATDHGICSFDNKSWRIYKVPGANSFNQNHFESVAVDQNNVKWFGARGLVYSFDGKLWTRFAFPQSRNIELINDVRAITVDNKNTKWFGVTGFGIFGFNGSQWKMLTVSDGLPSDNIVSLATDLNNRKWVSMWGAGIAAFNDDNMPWSDISVGIMEYGEMTGVGSLAPESFHLLRNYPNPFNPSTTILFTLVKAGDVRLNVYNSAGQLIETLVNRNMSAGPHAIAWKPASGLASGAYLMRLKADRKVLSRRIMFAK